MVDFGSVCSGIEAASVAWDSLNWRASWFAEIEAFPSMVLATRYPHVPNLGDMTRLADYVDQGLIDAPEVLVGGTPCQAFSVAGLRNSLDDERGQLSLSYIGLANAIDKQRAKQGKRKAIIVWENVPGVLSTKDNAFGCFLAGLAGESGELHAPGGKWPNAGCVYGPERAIAWRVFDAQYFGVAQRRRRVFVVASARNWFDPAEVLFEFDGVRRDIAPSRKTGQAVTGNAGNDTHMAVTVNRMVAFGEYVNDETASTMKARDYKDATDLVAYGIPGNWIGRAPENGGNAVEPMNNVSPCVTVTDRHGVCVEPTIQRGGDGGRHEGVMHEILPINTMTVQGRPSDDLNPRMGSGIGQPDDPQNTPTKAHMHGVFDPRVMAVRRLTPVECERLQGFPDNYTLITIKGKPAADGPRYKALGNSMAVPCMAWIGKRIQNMLDSGK